MRLTAAARSARESMSVPSRSKRKSWGFMVATPGMAGRSPGGRRGFAAAGRRGRRASPMKRSRRVSSRLSWQVVPRKRSAVHSANSQKTAAVHAGRRGEGRAGSGRAADETALGEDAQDAGGKTGDGEAAEEVEGDVDGGPPGVAIDDVGADFMGEEDGEGKPSVATEGGDDGGKGFLQDRIHGRILWVFGLSVKGRPVQPGKWFPWHGKSAIEWN